MSEITITKRNGEKEQLDLEKIKHPEPYGGESIKPSPSKSVSFNDTVTSSDTAHLKEILEKQKLILERIDKLEVKEQ